jgi:chloride channel 3/4/5
VNLTHFVQVPAGLFIPSMAIGACMGRAVGIGMQFVTASHRDWSIFSGCTGDDCALPGIYAVVGAAAALGGVTRMTVSLVVIFFELTGQPDHIVPLMAAVMASKWVGDGFGRDSINDLYIHLNGYPFLDPRYDFAHSSTVAQAMSPRLLGALPSTAALEATSAASSLSPMSLSTLASSRSLAVVSVDEEPDVQALEMLLEQTDYSGFPLVASRSTMAVVGYVPRAELRASLERARRMYGATSARRCVFYTGLPSAHVGRDESSVLVLKHCVDVSPVQITETTPTAVAIDMFRKLGLRCVMMMMMTTTTMMMMMGMMRVMMVKIM